MSSDWIFNSNSESDNIELIYCSAVLESCPPQYVFTIKMKSGIVLNFQDYKKHINVFSESDMFAIQATQDNLNALYNKEDNLYFNEDQEGYNLTKNKTFEKTTNTKTAGKQTAVNQTAGKQTVVNQTAVNQTQVAPVATEAPNTQPLLAPRRPTIFERIRAFFTGISC